jgi:hypothetical protein
MRNILIAPVLLLILLPAFASAATINAASCSYNDVSSAINSAQRGDTVLVPAGNCTWNSTLTITKGITLQGAGVDKTIIRSDGPSGIGVYTINFNADQATAANDYPFQLSGFTLQQITAVYGSLGLKNQNVSNALTKVVVHDNKFIGRAGNGTTIGIVHELGVFGVVYNNTIQDVSHAWRFLGTSAGWNQVEGRVPGTGNAMYYENNYIYLTSNVDSSLIVSGGGGNRYVGRYNTINLSVRAPSQFAQAYDIHGNQDNNPTAGIGLEIYGNHRISTSGNWLDQRGGQVFFFYNRWSGSSGTGALNVWEEYNDDAFSTASCPEGSLYPRTAAGNCLQRVRDSYFWRNYGGMSGTTLSSTSSVQFDHYHRGNGILNNPLTMFENVEWFRDNTIAFDGTIAPVGSCGYYNGSACTKSGVGCGTLAQMNAITPPASGLGFWVTDQSCTDLTGMVGRNPTTPISGTLYRAEDDGQGGYEWVAYYTPYIYPHPLTVAPLGTDICGEGQITSSCWCEGMKSNGYCCHGYYRTSDCGSPPQPEAYWVSPTGTSSWANCKSTSPLSGTAACSLTTANSNAFAGDTIYLRGGTYSGITGDAINPTNTGTAGNIITFSSYNGEDVQLIGSGTSSSAVNLDSQCQDGGTIHPCAVTRNYIKIHDLHFSNFNKHLWIRFGSHNEISYCSFIGMPPGSTLSTLDWSASYIYRNAYYNWVHHSTFGDYGICEPYDTDFGVVFQVGVESMLDSDFNNGYFTKYNLVENNEMYHGGHHVVSFNGINNVFRNNSFRNDPWCPLGNATYATRTFFQTGVPGDGQYNLVEGNRIGYGGPKNKIEIGGAGGTIAGAYNIWRRNVFLQVYTDAMWITYYEYQDHVKYNKIYNNVYWHGGYGSYQEWPGGTVPSPYWSDSYTHGICVGEYDDGSLIYGNVIKNNLFYDNRCLNGKNLSIIRYYPYEAPKYQIISNNWLDNAGDPKFVDISGTPNPTLIATQFDFHLQPNSPCIDHGGFLTTITSSSGSGTQFQVADAGYFMDGWGIIEGDMIQLQGQTAKARILSINYTTNTITVNTTLSWTTGLGVGLAYEGSAPDIGAYEYMNASTPPPVPGDINGDRLVDIKDLVLMALHFGQSNAHPLWNATVDMVANNEIDIFDVVFVASRFT